MPSINSLLLLLLLTFLSSGIPCENTNLSFSDLKGKVVGIKDGDTIDVLLNGKAETVRLADIDCPEKKQAYGNQAKNFTAAICFGKNVVLRGGNKRDRWKRILATVYVDTLNINAQLLKAGLAWHFTKYSQNPVYMALEKQARLRKAGLWADNNPVAPWEFRKK